MLGIEYHSLLEKIIKNTSKMALIVSYLME